MAYLAQQIRQDANATTSNAMGSWRADYNSVDYYADEFVFEDVTFFQTIDNKDDLYRAFLPFNDGKPDSPAGVHQFDVIRYDGGRAGSRRGIRTPDP